MLLSAKNEFPHLSHSLMEDLDIILSDNLKSGFKKLGIYPVAHEHISQRLLWQNNMTFHQSQSFLLEYLEKRQNDATDTTKPVFSTGT